MYTILAIEDSPRSQKLIKAALAGHHEIVLTSSTAGANDILSRQHIDLILLDVDIPGEDNLQFFSRFSQKISDKNIPVIFLTAHHEVSYKISAFKLGAADYITKPFEPAELLLRIEARMNDRKQKDTTPIDDELYIDHAQCAVFAVSQGEHKKIDLSLTEYKLTCLFAQQPNRLFSRDQIFDQVWGENTHYLDRTIDRHICSLKKKIPCFKLSLKTVYGMGYIFKSMNHRGSHRRSA